MRCQSVMTVWPHLGGVCMDKLLARYLLVLDKYARFEATHVDEINPYVRELFVLEARLVRGDMI
jgi:hypothetical protein